MPELLLELFSEEIPAKMQVSVAQTLFANLSSSLKECTGEESRGEYWVTPRRIGCVFYDIPEYTKASKEEIRGPKISAPNAALDGFLKKYNLNKGQLTQIEEYYYAEIHKESAPSSLVVSEVVANNIKNLVWPKSMRWGKVEITWVRPLHGLLCLFNNKILPMQYGHLKASNTTYGHRFLSKDPIEIADFADYKQKLEKNYVMLNPSQRKDKILEQIQNLLKGKRLQLIQDEELLDEIAGLVEYPIVLLGEIEQRFMELPKEVLMITLKHHQRYLMLADEKGELAPNYIIVANFIATDGGKEIIHGNSKVLKARLSDAEFFYKQDLKKKLSEYIGQLKKLTYHQQLGSVYEKIQDVKVLSDKIAAKLKIDKSKISKATELAKADLVTNMVKEFPELQGIMGYYYALNQGEDKDVAEAIRDHYKPMGPNDSIPVNPIGAVVAIADKIDTLEKMFSIGVKPTGSKDPYALRRAAIGLQRIIKSFNFDLPLEELTSNKEVLAFIQAKS
jgi:glycyl-tRNA synthetase beta chain